jgi:hypothetical protein
LNCYDINATETNFSTRNSFGKVWSVRELVHVTKIEMLIFS